MNEDPLQVPPKSRGLTAIAGAMSLIIVLVIVQIWLLTSSLEAYLAGRHHVALPAAIFSGLLFAGALALYVFIDRVDAESRH